MPRITLGAGALGMLGILAFSPSAVADEPGAPVAKADTPPVEKCGCECKCRTSCTCSDDKEEAKDAAGVVSGLRFSTLNNKGTDRDGTHVGAAFAGSADYFTDGGGSFAQVFYLIGGGSAGFEGALGGSSLVGARWNVAKHHGPVARAGFEGYLMGNEVFYHSALELPIMHLGWNYTRRDVALDIGARGGPVISGRYNPGDNGYRRLSGAIEYGGYFTAKTESVRFDLTAHRIDARSTGTGRPVDVAKGQLCAIFSPVGFCLDAMALRGDVMPDGGGAPYFAQTFYGGFMLAWSSKK